MKENHTGEPLRALTCIRGLAAWWVVMFHFREALPAGTSRWAIDIAGYGYLAVDLFFLLSGYVIALNYAKIFQRFDYSQTIYFILLRIGRIYPLHVFMMAIFLVNPLAIILFSAHGDPGQRYEPTYYIMSLALIQNWGFTDILAWNVPAWSISTEWFAYLIFPLLAFYVLRKINSISSGLLHIIAILTILAWLCHELGLTDLGDKIEKFGLTRCCIEFSCGIILWRLRMLRPVLAQGEGGMAVVAGLLCVVISLQPPMKDYYLVPLGFALIIWGLTDVNALPARLLAGRALEGVGLVSYSTYMVHYFVKDWVNFLLVRPEIPDIVPFPTYIAVTAVASVLLYHAVELPSRRWGRAAAGRWLQQVAARK